LLCAVSLLIRDKFDNITYLAVKITANFLRTARRKVLALAQLRDYARTQAHSLAKLGFVHVMIYHHLEQWFVTECHAAILPYRDIYVKVVKVISS
jgi:hypothetical protein